MNRIGIRYLAFAHLRFGVVDLLTQAFVLRIKIERFLPGIHSLRVFVHFRESVADVFEYDWIIAR